MPCPISHLVSIILQVQRINERPRSNVSHSSKIEFKGNVKIPYDCNWQFCCIKDMDRVEDSLYHSRMESYHEWL